MPALARNPCGSHSLGNGCPEEKVEALAQDLPAHREVAGWTVCSRTPRPDSDGSWTPSRLAGGLEHCLSWDTFQTCRERREAQARVRVRDPL